MKINDLRTDEKINKFAQLEIGDVFEAHGEVYLKITSTSVFIFNQLTTANWDLETEVKKLNAELTIYNYSYKES